MAGTPASDRSAGTRWVSTVTWLRLLAGIGALALVVYGRNLGDGFLSDDYVYLASARRSLLTLLRRVTVDSYPQTLRPVAAIPWMLEGVWGAPVVLHVISLIVHAVSASLIAWLVWRRGGSLATGCSTGLLFLVAPLFGEPVLWLSAAPDLWAAFFALLALAAIEGGRRAQIGAILYAMGLLSKESVFALPLVVPLVAPRRKWRGTTVWMAGVAGAYLALRWALFSGMGGYGSSMVPAVTPRSVAQTLLAHLPFAILVPFKRAYGMRWVFAPISAVIMTGLLVTCRRGVRFVSLSGALLVGLISMTPALPVIGLAVDLAGGRFFYFPLAMTLLALGHAVRAMPGKALGWVALLVIYWAAASHWNARSWSEASRLADATLNGMRALQERYPTGATIAVDAADSFDGAYVFRVGLKEAAEWHRLRPDLLWLRGTSGSLDDAHLAALGERVFLVGFENERPLDWTSCGRSMIEVEGKSPQGVTLTTVTPRRMVGRIDARAADAVLVTLTQEICQRAPAHGLLFWRARNERSFTMPDSQPMLLIAPRCGSLLRLPTRARRDGLEVRIDLAEGLPSGASLGIATLTAPAGACANET